MIILGETSCTFVIYTFIVHDVLNFSSTSNDVIKKYFRQKFVTFASAANCSKESYQKILLSTKDCGL